jgi:hypothetical protein
VANHLFKLLVSRILLSDTASNKTLQLKNQGRIQQREEFANIHGIENIFLAQKLLDIILSFRSMLMVM